MHTSRSVAPHDLPPRHVLQLLALRTAEEYEVHSHYPIPRPSVPKLQLNARPSEARSAFLRLTHVTRALTRVLPTVAAECGESRS